jgi:hypothetical protein
MLIDVILAVALVALVGVPLVVWFDRAKKEMERDDES